VEPTEKTRAENGIYLDHNASTPAHPEVITAIAAFMTSTPGNSASSHAVGRKVAAAVETARNDIANLVGTASPANVIFTSGATEANNLALVGYTDPARSRILVGATEHESVIAAATAATGNGGTIEIVPVDRSGLLDLHALSEMLNDQVRVVSVMAANSETGVLSPLAEVNAVAKAAGAIVHCDATQIFGRLPFNMDELGVDQLSLSSHKLGGPQGVGALVATRRVRKNLRPVLVGGGHEDGLRSGTVNAAGIAGFAAAARLAQSELEQRSNQMRRTRDNLEHQLAATIQDISINGAEGHRLPNTTNVRFAGTDAEAIMMHVDHIAISSGSACHSGAPEPSRVLTSMGLSRLAATECIRISTGSTTTLQEIDRAVADIAAAVQFVRAISATA